MLKGFGTATKSAGNFVKLALHRDLALNRNRVGNKYRFASEPFKIFRETRKPNYSGETVILVIGFKLKLVRSNPLLHWAFQGVCVLTTPIWSGIEGFKTKLWMVNPATKDYLGIYDWRGKNKAQAYINFLLPILKFFSVRGSVWAIQLYNKDFESFLSKHSMSNEERQKQPLVPKQHVPKRAVF